VRWPDGRRSRLPSRTDLADAAADQMRPKAIQYTLLAFAVGFVVGRILR
jgi:hypothetical protein